MNGQEMPAEPADRLVTKRRVVAQISLCQGCCCGNVARNKPAVPVDALKAEWKRLGLSKAVQLTISGCLGPCDVVNVARVSGCGRDEWVGNLTSTEDYFQLVGWADQCRNAGHYVALPRALRDKRFDPFRRPESASPMVYRPALATAAAGGAL